jgi:epoxyqueuosine reductase QueG
MKTLKLELKQKVNTKGSCAIPWKDAFAVKETDTLKQKLLLWGADLAGIGDLTGDANRSLSSEISNFTRVISIAVHCSAFEDEQVGINQQPTYYVRRDEAVRMLEHVLGMAARRLKRAGFRRLVLPPVGKLCHRPFTRVLYDLFPHRTGATCAGLGWIGKNGMLLNSRYGANLMWGTILTDAPLIPAEPIVGNSICSTCDSCVQACPANAIKGINWDRVHGNMSLIDVKACATYIDSNSDEQDDQVCAVCVTSCPLSRRSFPLC